jgi:hypothetical protein
MAQQFYPSFTLRSRRETSTRDTANARNYELWQTDGKYGVYNRPDPNRRAPFEDFMPTNSRTEDRKYHPQPRFLEDQHRLGENPYFQKYDPAYDSRNAVRELQAVVYEDKNIEGLRSSRELVGRQVEHRWITGDSAAAIAETAESLRPQRDDYTKVYR